TLTTSFTTDSVRDSLHPAILVEMHVGGSVGWGECVAGWSPGYSYETIGTATEIMTRFFIPSLIGKKDLSSLHKFRGHPMARMAVEAAFWTAIASQQGIPFGDLLSQHSRNVRRKPCAVVGVSIGIQPSIDATLAVIEKRTKEGYGRIKLKIKPGWDIEMLRAVRKTYPTITLMADANSAYTLDDLPLFKQMDDLDLLMI